MLIKYFLIKIYDNIADKLDDNIDDNLQLLFESKFNPSLQTNCCLSSNQSINPESMGRV